MSQKIVLLNIGQLSKHNILILIALKGKEQ